MDIKFNCMDKTFFILIASLIFFGCSTTQYEKENKSTLEVIERCYTKGYARVIVRDTETNVLYVDCYYSFVPLLNADGSLKLYKK